MNRNETGRVPLRPSTAHRHLERLAQQVAVAEAAVPVLGEGRVIRHIAFKAQPAVNRPGSAGGHRLTVMLPYTRFANKAQPRP